MAISNRKNLPEPYEFVARVLIGHSGFYAVDFQEHERAHGTARRDNNMRAAIVHVLADAAVSVLVIVGLLFGRFLGWTWIDPVAGLCGAVVIAAWSYGLVRDTGAVLLDMNPDQAMSGRMRAAIETDGDQLTDLHVWRLGPGHLGAVLSVSMDRQRGPEYYQSLLRRFRSLSHVEVQRL
jgi:cation diffusion facilitator family transporter